jgi:uncharacterized protein (DUF488 family)
MAEPAGVVHTVGHSVRPADEFLDLLRSHDIELVADVRALPRSRRHPQFSREPLRAALERAGILYEHMPELGGLRAAVPRGGPNGALRDDAMRAYAEHMGTPAFRAALDALAALASGRRVAVMCAEALPARCHRALLADALVARGVPVRHIVGPGTCEPHAPRAAARFANGEVSYPGTE